LRWNAAIWVYFVFPFFSFKVFYVKNSFAIILKMQAKDTNNVESTNPPGNYSEHPLDKLSRIDGLNIDLGLSHVGHDLQLYIMALRSFAENFGIYLEELDKALKSEDWQYYSVKAHAIKGILAIFGAEKLSHWVGRLEEASIAGEGFSPELCREETWSFSEDLAQFIYDIRLTSILDSE
jgi:HPt (histidine-containing phosphotransfer) domain-containing protein